MIIGEVNHAREATITLVVKGHAKTGQIDAVIDTGFNDELTLPAEVITALDLRYAAPAQASLAGGHIVEVDYFRATVQWDNAPREVLVLELEGTPLVGMGLLDGHRLIVDALPKGRVTIETLEASR